MPVDNLLAHREPGSRSWIFSSTVQPLEDAKDAIRVLGIEPDAVVLHGDAQPLLRGHTRFFRRDDLVGVLRNADLND